MQRRRCGFALTVGLVAGAVGSLTALSTWAESDRSSAAEACAREFLESWVYRDFDRLWDLLDEASRTDLTPGDLTGALESLPIVVERAEVVSVTADEDGFGVRYRLHGVHAVSGVTTTLPGTLRVAADDGRCAVIFRPPTMTGAVSGGSGPGEFGSVGQASQSAVPGLPPSQVIDGLTAQDVLDRAAAAHGQLEALRMGVDIHSSLLGEVSALRGEFLYRSPNQLRLDLGDVLFVCNGPSATMYIAPANAYVRLPNTLSTDLLGIAPGLGSAGSSMQASLIARETVAGRPAHHLALAPAQGSGGDLMGVLGSMGPTHIWLDAETSLPLRSRTGVMGMVMDLTFSDVEVNPTDLSPHVFEFQPPPGAMEIPMMLPALGGG